MKVHFMSPYGLEKNLGLEYNSAMQLIGDDDWCCLMDYDTLFLTPDAPAIVIEYARRNPDAALMTCLTNRVHPASRQQLFREIINDRSDIRKHIETAELCKRDLYKTEVVKHNVSGMLMLMSKKQWKETPFTEDLKCLGVDTALSETLRERGQDILLCKGLYIFHTYRLISGIRDKSHLL